MTTWKHGERLMSKRDQVRLIALKVTDRVDEQIEVVNELMSDSDQTPELRMLKSIFNMTSMSTLMQAAKLAVDMDELEK